MLNARFTVRRLITILVLSLGLAVQMSAEGQAQLAADAFALEAIKVSELPVIDGDPSDPVWRNAPKLTAASFTMQAVYTDNEIAFLSIHEDPTLRVNTSGAWSLVDGTWKRQMEAGPWESFLGQRHPVWFAIMWNMNIGDFSQSGCTYTCHEGTGNHHDVVGRDLADNWHILAKHGYGPSYFEGDQGWLAGGSGVRQDGPVTFVSNDPIDSHAVASGRVTFLGWAEDKLQKATGSDHFNHSSPATDYCNACHGAGFGEDHALRGDDGHLPYFRNGVGAGPLYMETAPTDWADAMVLTQAEIYAGEAVRVDTLSPSQVAQYWKRYQAVNGVVPELVLKQPTGSQADIAVGARWENGRWTIEFTRKLVTGSPDDVQFDDLTRKYYFNLSLWTTTDISGDVCGQPLHLRFRR